MPCVDGSELARTIFTSQRWSVQPCVRPKCAVHMTAGHNPSAGALQLQHVDLPATDEPFAMVILCTADRQKVDKRTRSKWSRVLRYAAEYKTSAEPLAKFIQRKGRINNVLGGLPVASVDTIETER